MKQTVIGLLLIVSGYLFVDSISACEDGVWEDHTHDHEATDGGHGGGEHTHTGWLKRCPDGTTQVNASFVDSHAYGQHLRWAFEDHPEITVEDLHDDSPTYKTPPDPKDDPPIPPPDPDPPIPPPDPITPQTPVVGVDREASEETLLGQESFPETPPIDTAEGLPDAESEQQNTSDVPSQLDNTLNPPTQNPAQTTPQTDVIVESENKFTLVA